MHGRVFGWFFLFRYKWSLLLLQMHYRCFSWLSVLYTFWLLLNHIYSFSSLSWYSSTASFEVFQDSAFTAFFIFGFTCLQIGHIETFVHIGNVTSPTIADSSFVYEIFTPFLKFSVWFLAQPLLQIVMQFGDYLLVLCTSVSPYFSFYEWICNLYD